MSRDFIGTMYRAELTARIESNFRYVGHDRTEYEAARAASRRTIAPAFAFAEQLDTERASRLCSVAVVQIMSGSLMMRTMMRVVARDRSRGSHCGHHEHLCLMPAADHRDGSKGLRRHTQRYEKGQQVEDASSHVALETRLGTTINRDRSKRFGVQLAHTMDAVCNSYSSSFAGQIVQCPTFGAPPGPRGRGPGMLECTAGIGTRCVGRGLATNRVETSQDSQGPPHVAPAEGRQTAAMEVRDSCLGVPAVLDGAVGLQELPGRLLGAPRGDSHRRRDERLIRRSLRRNCRITEVTTPSTANPSFLSARYG